MGNLVQKYNQFDWTLFKALSNHVQGSIVYPKF